MEPLSRLAPRYHRGDLASFWNRVELERPANYWEENMVAARRKVRSVITTWLDPLPAERILDAGCGVGNLARFFARRGARVTGIDLVPRFRCQPAPPGLDFAVADLRRPVCAGADFTTALLQEVLEDYQPQERLPLFQALGEWGTKRIVLAARMASPWGEWADRLASPASGGPFQTVELVRGIHLQTSYSLTRREIVRRRNYAAEIFEFSRDQPGPGAGRN